MSSQDFEDELNSYFTGLNNATEHTLWVEKYRPTDLDTYIGNDQLKSKVSHYLDSGDLPHLLLYGKAGTGKTTLQVTC